MKLKTLKYSLFGVMFISGLQAQKGPFNGRFDLVNPHIQSAIELSKQNKYITAGIAAVGAIAAYKLFSLFSKEKPLTPVQELNAQWALQSVSELLNPQTKASAEGILSTLSLATGALENGKMHKHSKYKDVYQAICQLNKALESACNVSISVAQNPRHHDGKSLAIAWQWNTHAYALKALKTLKPALHKHNHEISAEIEIIKKLERAVMAPLTSR